MKLKMDADGHAVVQDGKPVYVHDDGKEIAFDAAHSVATISRLNAEAKGHREAKEAAETRLKAFDGIEDPAAAIKALSTMKNLDDKKLVDAGDVERVKAAAIEAIEAKYAPVVKEVEGLRGELYAEKIGGAFARSPFIKDKVAIPADILQASFERNFKIEEGKVVPYDPSGNRVFSRAKPGEIADFEEAIEFLVTNHPQKDSILKGSPGAGGGARPGQAPSNGGAKTLTRAAFQSLSPIDQMARVREGVTVTD